MRSRKKPKKMRYSRERVNREVKQLIKANYDGNIPVAYGEGLPFYRSPRLSELINDRLLTRETPEEAIPNRLALSEGGTLNSAATETQPAIPSVEGGNRLSEKILRWFKHGFNKEQGG